MSCLASFSSWHVSCVPRDVNFMAHSLAAWFLGCKFVMSRKPLPSLLFSVSLSLFFFFAQMWGKVFVLCMSRVKTSTDILQSYKLTIHLHEHHMVHHESPIHHHSFIPILTIPILLSKDSKPTIIITKYHNLLHVVIMMYLVSSLIVLNW